MRVTCLPRMLCTTTSENRCHLHHYKKLPTSLRSEKTQAMKMLGVQAMLFWGYLWWRCWCCCSKALEWEPSASLSLPVKHSHLWENFKDPGLTPPLAVAENECLVTLLQTWLKTSVGCSGASRFDCSSSCSIGLLLAAYLIDCQQKWSQPGEWCSLHLILIPKTFFFTVMTVSNSRVGLKYWMIKIAFTKYLSFKRTIINEIIRKLQSDL